MKDESVFLPNPVYRLSQLADDYDVFAASIIDRYQARPPFLSNMHLARFAVNYNPISGSTVTAFQNDDPHNDDDDDDHDQVVGN